MKKYLIVILCIALMLLSGCSVRETQKRQRVCRVVLEENTAFRA